MGIRPSTQKVSNANEPIGHRISVLDNMVPSFLSPSTKRWFDLLTTGVGRVGLLRHFPNSWWHQFGRCYRHGRRLSVAAARGRWMGPFCESPLSRSLLGV